MLALNMFFLRAGQGFGPAPGWAATDPVTIVSRRDNVSGNRKQRVWSVTGDSGYTLLTRLKVIDSVMWDDATITGISQAGPDGVLTITSSGAYTAAEITVIGN